MHGSIVAFVTPFNDLDEIDYKEVDRLVDFHLKNKTNGLLLLGTTAESETLSDSEKVELVSHISSYVAGKIDLMVGIISNVTDEVVRLAGLFKGIDFKYYLVINPYYNKTNVSGMLKHFSYIADHVDHPIVLYNVPKRTGMNIDFEVVRFLSYHKNIIGIKDASGDIIYHLRLLNLQTDNFFVYCGDDSLMFVSRLLGSKGNINVIGNAFPLEVSLITCGAEDIAKMTFYKLFNLMSVMYNEVSPIGIKYIMFLIGFETLNCRMPLDVASKEFKRILEEKVLEIVE